MQFKMRDVERGRTFIDVASSMESENSFIEAFIIAVISRKHDVRGNGAVDLFRVPYLRSFGPSETACALDRRFNGCDVGVDTSCPFSE